MLTVYVAHPLGQGPDRETNRVNAAKWCAWIARTFKCATIADWIVISGQWEETDDNRAAGLEIDKELVGRADQLWLVGGRVSPGMQIEAEHARSLGIPVIDLTALGFTCPGAA